MSGTQPHTFSCANCDPSVSHPDVDECYRCKDSGPHTLENDILALSCLLELFKSSDNGSLKNSCLKLMQSVGERIGDKLSADYPLEYEFLVNQEVQDE